MILEQVHHGLTSALVLAASVALPASSHAQQTVTLTYSVAWDKSQIAPGEANQGAIVCTIEPALGSTIAWTTPPGTGQLGTLQAFASSIFSLMNAGNGLKGNVSYAVPTSLNLSQGPGKNPDEFGNIKGLQAGQFGPPVNPIPVYDNPIVICNIEWKAFAAASEPYEVAYFASSTSGKVYLDVGLPSGTWVAQKGTLQSAAPSGFIVTPGPGSVSTLLLGLGVGAARVRRRG